MKPVINILFILFGLICLCSCRNKPYPRNMQLADLIVNTKPDSAVALLNTLKTSILSEPRSTRMYYNLLSIKANDKAYIPHTSDSIIRQVVHYYEHKKDKKHLPEAYYYAGRIYRDLGDAPQALDYFQKAVEVSDERNNEVLFSRIYNQMGTLYLYQDIYDEALRAYKKAYHYSLLAKDSVAVIFSLRDIGDTFTGYNNTDSALYYYEEAYAQAKLVKDQHSIDMVQIGLAGLYRQLKKYDLAKETLQSLSNNLTQERRSAVSLISADVFLQHQQLDSASYHYNKLLQIGTIFSKQAAHLALAEIAQKQENYQKILEHINQYIAYTKLIQNCTNTESIRKMQSLYNYQLRVKENNLLRIQNARQELWIIYGLLSLSILLAIFGIYTQYSKCKKRQLQEQLNKLKIIEESQYQKSNDFIEENKRQIQELERQLGNSTEQNDILCALFEAQKEQMIQTNYKITTDQREQELAEAAFRQSDIYNHFHAAASDESIKLSKENWIDLQIHIDRCYKNFTLRLRALYPISNIELQISLLLKANISITGVALLTGRSKSAIVSARKSLYEKVHGEKGKPEQWDAFVIAL